MMLAVVLDEKRLNQSLSDICICDCTLCLPIYTHHHPQSLRNNDSHVTMVLRCLCLAQQGKTNFQKPAVQSSDRGPLLTRPTCSKKKPKPVSQQKWKRYAMQIL